MNIEREFPLHVAVWNDDVEKLSELLRTHKVSSTHDCLHFCYFQISNSAERFLKIELQR